MKEQVSLSLVIAWIILMLLSCDRKAVSTGPSDGERTASNSTPANGTFSDEAQAYESADRVIWQKPDLVIQQLGQVEGKVVADLGAGTGYFSRRIAYKGAKVIAIDIDPRAIQWMEEQKARFPVELQDRLVIRQAEPDDPKLRPNEVDIVLLVNTYSYIQDRVTYFSNLEKTIRPGGFIVIIDFKKKDTPFGPPVADRIDAADVQQELTQAGYTGLTLDAESLDYQYIIKAKKK